jgi:RimJ/RimL family protein N-acetyltransferase
MEIPTLETELLHLRAHRLEDYPRCAALWSDEGVTRYINELPLTAEEVWSRLLRYVGHWMLLGFGYWVAEEKRTGEFLGEVGFASLKRMIHPALDDTPEAGWVFSTSSRGRGFATEAVRAILGWGQMHFRTPTSVCLVHPDNTPSLRLAAKVGYRETERTVYRGRPVIILHRNW